MQATTNVNVKDSYRNNRPKMSRSSKINEAMTLPEELVDLIKEEEDTKTYSGGFLAVVVIIILLGLIGLVTYFTMQKSENVEKLMPVYFSDIFNVTSLFSQFEYQWKNGYLIFRNSSGNIYSVKTTQNFSSPSIILPEENYSPGMTISFDLSMWLSPNIQRQTKDLENEYTYKLFHASLNTSYSWHITLQGHQRSFFRSISWGPRSKYLAAVYGMNIYYSLNPFISSSFICISCHLNQTHMYGQLTGFYKENIFKTNKAYWWNGNGQFLAFLSLPIDKNINASSGTFSSDFLDLDYYNMSNTESPTSQLGSKVGIHAIDLASHKLYTLDLDKYVSLESYRIIHIQWYNNTFLMVVYMSDEETDVGVILCEVMKINCFKIFTKSSSDYVDMEEYQNILIDDYNGYIYIAISVSEYPDSRKQIKKIKVDRNQGNLMTWLNVGDQNIIKIKYFDPISGSLYYLASSTNASEVHLYRFFSHSMKITCESCKFTSCYRNEIYFMEKHQAFLHSCLGPEPISYQLIQPLGDSYQSEVLESNEELRKVLRKKSLSREEYVSLNIYDSNQRYTISAKISHPRQLNPEHVTKYPVIVILLDSPRKTIINENFSFGWIDYITSYLSYVVVEMELRGPKKEDVISGKTSSEKVINQNLYLVIETMKELLRLRSYMDNSSIGIIGENHNGYIITRLLSETKEFPDFRCTVAINPIINSALFDSFFVEQYSQYQSQYQDPVVQASANKKELLLVHSANKKEFSFDNSAKFIKSLVSKNTNFDLLLLYNDKNAKTNWNTNKYCLKKMTKFFVNCFNRSSATHTNFENDILHSL